MKNGNIISRLSPLSMIIIALILGGVFIAGLSLAGSYETDKNAPAKAGDEVSVYYSLSLFSGRCCI